MPSLKSRLTRVFSQAFVSQGFAARLGEVTVSNRPDLAHFQCNGALGAAKSQKKNPNEVAQSLLTQASTLLSQEFGESAFLLSIAGPGFINILVSDAELSRWIQKISDDPRLGVAASEKPKTVVIDLGGPNVAKSLHVGHLRSPIIGDSLVKIHRFMGDQVIADNHLGDWGTPMGMLICSVQEKFPALPYFDSQYKGAYPEESPVSMEDMEKLYPEASKRAKTDPAFHALALQATAELQGGNRGYKALWQHFQKTTIRELEKDFDRLGIRFDSWLGESFYEDKMPILVERLQREGKADASEGAWVITVSDATNPDMPPLILVKSGGGYLYGTSDLATVEYRVSELKADLILYVVDKRQSLHFKQVFAAAKKTGIAGQADLVHTGFGTMNGKDGKPFKTRDGGTIKLKDILQMVNDEARKRIAELGADKGYSAQEIEDISHKIGNATLKYADLKNNRMVDYVFDAERFSQFEGNTGPYLLYAAVRIKSISRKAEEFGLKVGAIATPIHATERNLMLEMLKLSDVMALAYEVSEPHHLADYGYALAQAFSSFYKECHILNEKDPARQSSWLRLCKTAHDQVELCLSLLGIEVPKRM